jgi:hypothetical protein
MADGRWLLAAGLWRLATGHKVPSIESSVGRPSAAAVRWPAQRPALHFSKLKNRIWREAEYEDEYENEDDI